nr:MAG: glycoprotein [Rovyktys virus]
MKTLLNVVNRFNFLIFLFITFSETQSQMLISKISMNQPLEVLEINPSPNCQVQIVKDEGLLSFKTILNIWGAKPDEHTSTGLKITCRKRKNNCYQGFFGLVSKTTILDTQVICTNIDQDELNNFIFEVSSLSKHRYVSGSEFFKEESWDCAWLQTRTKTVYYLSYETVQLQSSIDNKLIYPIKMESCNIYNNQSCKISDSVYLVPFHLNNKNIEVTHKTSQECQLEHLFTTAGILSFNPDSLNKRMSKKNTISIFKSIDKKLNLNFGDWDFSESNIGCSSQNGNPIFLSVSGLFVSLPLDINEYLKSTYAINNSDEVKQEERTFTINKKDLLLPFDSRLRPHDSTSSRKTRNVNTKKYFSKYSFQKMKEFVLRSHPLFDSLSTTLSLVGSETKQKRPRRTINSEWMGNHIAEYQNYVLDQALTWTKIDLITQLEKLWSVSKSQLEALWYQECINDKFMFEVAKTLKDQNPRLLVSLHLGHEKFLTSISNSLIVFKRGVPVKEILIDKPFQCNSQGYLLLHSKENQSVDYFLIPNQGIMVESLKRDNVYYEDCLSKHFYVPLKHGGYYDLISNSTTLFWNKTIDNQNFFFSHHQYLFKDEYNNPDFLRKSSYFFDESFKSSINSPDWLDNLMSGGWLSFVVHYAAPCVLILFILCLINCFLGPILLMFRAPAEILKKIKTSLF